LAYFNISLLFPAFPFSFPSLFPPISRLFPPIIDLLYRWEGKIQKGKGLRERLRERAFMKTAWHNPRRGKDDGVLGV
jgi:hypothetical protein